MGNSIKDIADFILSIRDEFPPWISETLLVLLGMLLIVWLFRKILKVFEDEDFKKSLLFIGKTAKNASARIANDIIEQAKSPIDRPCAKFVGAVFSVINSYILAVIFFSITCLIVVLYSDSNGELHFITFFYFLFWVVIFFYLTLVFRAEADRDYLRVKELLKKCRNKT